MMHIFIFNNASRAANYGIGTYVRLLSDGLLGRSGVKVSFVDLFSDVKEYSIADDERGCRHYQVPALFSGMENEPYCRNVFYFLTRHIKAADDELLKFFYRHYGCRTGITRLRFPKNTGNDHFVHFHLFFFEFHP